MSTVTCNPTGTWLRLPFGAGINSPNTLQGGASTQECVGTETDSKDVLCNIGNQMSGGNLVTQAVGGVEGQFDTSLISNGATITGLSARVNHKVTVNPDDIFFAVADPVVAPDDWAFSTVLTTFTPSTFTGVTFVQEDYDIFAATGGLDPADGLPWTKDKITNYAWGVGVDYFGDPNLDYTLDYLALRVTFTAAGPSSWYFDPNTNAYQYTDVDPGAPWVLQVPTLTATTATVPSTYRAGVATPTAFATAGGCAGTPVTINGTGFGLGATVTIGGVAATSVVVVNSTQITCVSPAHADGNVDIIITNLDTSSVTITNGYVYFQPWWIRTFLVVVNNVTYAFQAAVQQCTPPAIGIWVLFGFSDPTLSWWFEPTLHWWAYQITSPGLTWISDSAPDEPNGWFVSPWSFGGGIEVVGDSQRPKAPRTWTQIATWAAGSRAMLGGSPAASVTVRNRMVYPSSTYTPSLDPTLRIFDGSFDHELCSLPPVNGTAAVAVMSMLAANGTIYLTTFDSGTTSADWTGRVFSLDILSGVLSPIGDAFTAGEMPYALAWHMGRLWVGTNNGIGTVGKIYFFRPGIDSSWTLDHNVSTETAGAVTALVSFQGKLYVGTVNAAAARGKVLVRDQAGAYTVSLTGTGGTAKLNNGYLALFNSADTNLIATYWNDDTTAIAKIQAYDGSAWTTPFTGATTSLRPYIVLFSDGTFIYAIGGGLSRTGAIIRSVDGGTTWLDLTAELPEADKTLLPIVGVEVI